MIEDKEIGEVIHFSFWIKPFPVLSTSFRIIRNNGMSKNFFSGYRKNNPISCLDKHLWNISVSLGYVQVMFLWLGIIMVEEKEKN